MKFLFGKICRPKGERLKEKEKEKRKEKRIKLHVLNRAKGGHYKRIEGKDDGTTTKEKKKQGAGEGVRGRQKHKRGKSENSNRMKKE